jgi:hypothetical protein
MNTIFWVVTNARSSKTGQSSDEQIAVIFRAVEKAKQKSVYAGGKYAEIAVRFCSIFSLAYSFTLKMVATYSSETPGSIRIAQRYKLEDRTL